MAVNELSNFVDGLGKKAKKISDSLKEQDSAIYSSESFVKFISDMVIAMSGDLTEVLEELEFTTEEIVSVSLEDGITVFLSGERPESFVGYLVMSSEILCEELGASYLLHGISAFCTLYFVAKKELAKASQFLAVLLQPLMTAMRIEDVPKDAGRMGGRPEHPRKEEALKIARQKWEQMEYASINVVATTVKHILEKKYTDSPSLPAIKKWLTTSEFRPARSVK
jgi:hypothetical protein